METDRKAFIRRLLAALVTALVFILVVHRVWKLEHDTAPRAFCLTLMLSLALAIAVASGRAAFGTFCAASLMGVVWLASGLKLAYLHQPLMAPDLRYMAGTLAHDVIGHYPGLLRKCIVAIVGGGALAVGLWRLESPGWWRGRKRPRLVASMLAMLPLLACLWPQGPFRNLYATPAWNFISEGERHPITTFIRSFHEMRIELPPRAAHVDAKAWRAPPGAAPAGNASRPDIFAVLEESTLDPRQWADCTVPRCTLPMFEPDAATRAHGLLRVHTYGGATWTSEFTFLAGMPQTVFGPSGIYAPYNLAPRLRQSLPRQLKALGYRTVVINQTPANFVNAAEAYKSYGFDELHDSAELGLDWKSTDSDLFARAQALYRRLRAEDGRPLFFFVLTMRQHGPHDYPLDTLPAPYDEPPARRLGDRLDRNLATYLYRLHLSDTALAALRTELFTDGRPTLLVHFGDHHPSFDGLETTLRSAVDGEHAADASSDTYYRIDTNFPAPAVRNGGVLDLAFLASTVLDVAGLPKNPYFQANARLREACSGLFQRCPRDTLEAYFGYVFDDLRAFDE